MERFSVVTTSRQGAGKGVSRRLRSVGQLPAVLYGHKEAPVGLAVGEAEMRRILVAHPDSPIVDLTVEGGKAMNAIIRDVQRHPLTGRLLHIDFQRISLDEEVRVDVHVELLGTPAGVKEHGGMLEHGTRSLTIMCLPGEIPEAIKIDVSAMMMHDAFKVRDMVERYPGIKFLDEPETTIAAVHPPTVEVAPAELEADAEAPLEPELIKKEPVKDEE